jgi:hypothetical protein
MNSFLALPGLFLTFWYIQAPKNILLYFGSLNKAFLQLVSIPLFLKTFFKPWKNEYREGLVGFSIGMGIFVKSMFLLVGTLFYLGLLTVELSLFLAFLLWPVATVAVFFAHL